VINDIQGDCRNMHQDNESSQHNRGEQTLSRVIATSKRLPKQQTLRKQFLIPFLDASHTHTHTYKEGG